MSLDAFAAQAKNAAAGSPTTNLPSGNSPEAVQIANEIRQLVQRRSERSERSTQVHLGPSELGVLCDRQIVAKLVRAEKVNDVTNPWPSIVGTSVHAWLEEAFQADDSDRWLTERRVTPMDGHTGTADLYDKLNQRVLDHKVLGTTTLNKLRTNGPSKKYFVQLLLYARGYENDGYPVRQVGITAWPRLDSSLSKSYVWLHDITDDDRQLVDVIVALTAQRKHTASLVLAGEISLSDVDAYPDDSECYFCPIYGPDGRGCPGTKGKVNNV